MCSSVVRKSIATHTLTLLFGAISLSGGCSVAETAWEFRDSPVQPIDAGNPRPLADSPSHFSTAASFADGTPQPPSLFSADYVNTVGRDIACTFTAPVRWDGRDWLVAGGAAA